MLLKCTLSSARNSKPTIHRFFLFNQGLCRNLTKLWNRIHWQFGLNWKKKIDLQHINPSLCYVTLTEVFTLQLPAIPTAHVSTDWICCPNGTQLAVLGT